ncbi:hypothetical protein [Jiangella anatolica]|uniref:Uncharacterized protein n=1 Tax=Jiangella anatolica TaxID=2670374 RepID=A0A2W2AVI4_9ACTN|nr:hypothetical protein [Jiangella anatolica]PZF79225.1 hypothetical protein C1I92_32265 [Jiangella anatolica]
MNDVDNELRRILHDDRLALTPSAGAVETIVRGARRRRTSRAAATAVGSAGLAAVVTVGAFAVTGQFGGDTDGLQPAAPAPDAEPVVVYPNEGIDGFTVGTKLTELEGIEGVEITAFTAADGYGPLCYGEYRSENAHGFISTRGTFGEVPADLTPHYEVATMHFDVPVATPEGITAGSSDADVLAAYTAAFAVEDGIRAELDDGGRIIVRAWEFPLDKDEVSEVVLDGAANCEQVPILDRP